MKTLLKLLIPMLMLTGCTAIVPVGKSIPETSGCIGVCEGDVTVFVEHGKADESETLRYGVYDYELRMYQSVGVLLNRTLVGSGINSTINNSTDDVTKVSSKSNIISYEIINYEIDFATTIFSDHVVNVSILYTLFDDKGEILLSEKVQGTSNSSMSSSEVLSHMFIPMDGITANSYASSIATAWDIAVLDSIEAFVMKAKPVMVNGSKRASLAISR